MSMIPITLGDARRPSRSASPTRSPARRAGSPATARRRSSQFRARRDDRREVGHHPRGDGGVRARVARARAAGASDEGRFEREIVPLEGVTADEGPARARTLEKIRSLQPLVEGGRLTAAVSSQISDAAAAMLVVVGARAAGARPHAAGPHPPPLACAAPTRSACSPRRSPRPRTRSTKAGMTLDDIDLVEINEAFASVVLAWQQETGADLGEGQRERRRDRARPPARRDRRPADDDAARTSSSAPAAATACRRCARAAARPTSPSSNVWRRPSTRRASSGRRRRPASVTWVGGPTRGSPSTAWSATWR